MMPIFVARFKLVAVLALSDRKMLNQKLLWCQSYRDTDLGEGVVALVQSST